VFSDLTRLGASRICFERIKFLLPFRQFDKLSLGVKTEETERRRKRRKNPKMLARLVMLDAVICIEIEWRECQPVLLTLCKTENLIRTEL
jgi:hypothetical protein